MPSKLPHIFVRFQDSELHALVVKDAAANERSESAQMVWIAKQFYATKKQESELFIEPKLHEAKQQRRVPVFESADRPDSEQVSKLRDSLRKE